MRLLIGSDVGEFVFSASSKTVKILNVPYTLKLKNILGVINYTTGQILFNAIRPTTGGSISNNILTQEADLSENSDSDELQVWVDIPELSNLSDVVESVRALRQLLHPLTATADRSSNRQRVTAILESGTVTTCTTVGTVNTVTNVNLSNNLGFLLSNNAWNNSVRRRFS